MDLPRTVHNGVADARGHVNLNILFHAVFQYLVPIAAAHVAEKDRFHVS